MRRVAALLVVGLGLGLAPAAARAENGWEAKWLGQSEYPTLESGETVTSFLLVQNVGTKTWTRENTLLGTSSPRDRDSAFHVPEVWRNARRIVPIDSPLAPQAKGRFTFPMRAPTVSATTPMEEYFEPVADNPADSGWMGNTANWSGVFLRYTVLAPQNPTVQFNSAPFAISRGEPIELTATATDNRAVSDVAFFIRGRDGSVAGQRREGSTYTGTLDSSPLPPGTYTVVARATDPSRRSSEATTTVTVREPPPGPAGPPAPGATSPTSPTSPTGSPARSFRLRVAWTYRGRRTRVRRMTVSGLPTGATVRLRCSRRDCGFRRRSVATRGRSRVKLARHFKGRRLRTGTRVILRIARPGLGTTTFTFRMRTGALPAVRQRCRSAGGAKVPCGG